MYVFFVHGRHSWSRYKSFFMDTLNDARAWPLKWSETSNLRLADWAVELADSEDIQRAAPGLPGLSVTFMTYRPRLTMFDFENWMNVPEPVPMYSLAQYRTYLVLHECGHALGFDHPKSSIRSTHGDAPVMLQQTLGIGHLRPNVWPLSCEKLKATYK